MRRRDVLAAALIAVAAATIVNLPTFDGQRGASIDLLFWLRYEFFEKPADPATAPVVVVAIDEETYRRPPFAETPNVMWTREVAQVLTAVVAGGAKVVGFDVIYPTSIDKFVPGFERDFLVALRAAARPGKLVLGKVQHQQSPINPFSGQRIAVGVQRNIRSVNLYNDPDDVIRRVDLFFTAVDSAGKREEPGFAFELAQRALGQTAERRPDGTVMLGDWTLPGAQTKELANTLAVNFRGGNDIPTYSFADLAACAQEGRPDFFTKHFAGKVVLLGTVLSVEDRKLTSKRLVTAPEGPSTGERCVYPPMNELFSGVARDSLPGVLVHASVIRNIIDRDPLWFVPRWAETAGEILLAALTVAVGLFFSPGSAAVALIALGLGWTAVATYAATFALMLPLVTPLAAIALAFPVVLGYRFAIADRDKRFLRQSFSLYLAPALVDRLVEGNRAPALGGEMREITVFFSDLAGFTSFTENTDPARVVSMMNEYLTAMTELIEQHGGMVDKYIGDAIVAIFGAPLDDPDHAINAVRAALACEDKLAELNTKLTGDWSRTLAHRIGINTGKAIVGNIGSRGRFNYTAMGDAVTLAARLEGANKFYGTRVLISEATALAAGRAVVFREIDTVRVVGRAQEVTLFEPLTVADRATATQRSFVTAYAQALAAWRRGEFSAAAEAFSALATDPAARRFAEQARSLADHPPGAGWQPITVLDAK